MMKGHAFSIAIASALSLAAPWVWAQPPAAGRAPLAERFDALDRDRDGKLDQREVPRPLHGQADGDKDGFVTRQEAQAFFAGRFPQRDTPDTGSAAQPEGGLGVVGVVFELCVHDVESCARFYRDGIGMRQVEPANADKSALLEWAGCYLRLRKVPGDAPATASRTL